MKAIRVHNPGGPESLVYEDVPDAKPEANQALIKVEAAGVNFADIYARRGANPNATLPLTPGIEAAGTIVQVGADVQGFRPGDRVAVNGISGSYSEMVNVPAGRLLRLPGNVSTKQGAASLLQGLTAHALACDTFPLKAGDSCLVHAAAGGVGLLLCQIAKMRGARVIGTVSTEEKAKAAREAGADEVILYTQADFVEETKRLTDGRGVDVVYDGVGADTFLKSMDCIRPLGMMVSYGQSSGAPEPINPAILGAKGSLFLTRAGMGTYTSTREALERRANEIFDWVGSGKLKARVHSEFPLKDAAKAHEALEHRETIGKVLLVP
jgi:NADPH2:quinone reductase